MGTVRKPLAVFHGFHSLSEGEKGEVALSLRRLTAALLLSLFSLNIRDYSASLLGEVDYKAAESEETGEVWFTFVLEHI